jgi:acyl-CoA oxidase
MTIPLKDSTSPDAPSALARLDQLKRQLNLTPSAMSLQAPKDMAAERASADFNIDALARFWIGGDVKYERTVKRSIDDRKRPITHLFLLYTYYA